MAPALGGRFEKFRSRVFKKALAAAGVDATTMSHVPIFINMTGPYFFAIFARVTCGMAPSRGRAPIIGHPFGPGGRFFRVFKKRDRIDIWVMKKRRKEMKISRRRNVSRDMSNFLS